MRSGGSSGPKVGPGAWWMTSPSWRSSSTEGRGGITRFGAAGSSTVDRGSGGKARSGRVREAAPRRGPPSPRLGTALGLEDQLQRTDVRDLFPRDPGGEEGELSPPGGQLHDA